MRLSLRDLLRALVGEIGFSQPLETLATQLFNGQLPTMWAKMNPSSDKQLGSWMMWFQRCAIVICVLARRTQGRYRHYCHVH